MIRVVLLSATIAALLCMWADSPPAPPPSYLETLVPHVSQVDYCEIDEWAAAKDRLGQWEKFWSEGYGPCSLQDRFREI
jgi:hypothetical protein